MCAFVNSCHRPDIHLGNYHTDTPRDAGGPEPTAVPGGAGRAAARGSGNLATWEPGKLAGRSAGRPSGIPDFQFPVPPLRRRSGRWRR